MTMTLPFNPMPYSFQFLSFGRCYNGERKRRRIIQGSPKASRCHSHSSIPIHHSYKLQNSTDNLQVQSTNFNLQSTTSRLTVVIHGSPRLITVTTPARRTL